MVERVDSVHIKIKIDVDEESKAFAENLSSGMARADEEKIKKQAERKEQIEKDSYKGVLSVNVEIDELKEAILILERELDNKYND